MATKHPINAFFLTSKCCTTKLSLGVSRRFIARVHASQSHPEASSINEENNEKAKQAEAEKKKKKDERDAKRDGVKKFLDPKDKNNDGSLSLDEFLIGETDVAQATTKFNEANKNGDRFLTKAAG